MENLQKDFLPYELSLKMKQLGFDEPCLAKYITSDLVVKGCYKDSHILHALFEENEICEAHILVPTFSQAFRWFREKHNLDSRFHTYTHHKDGNRTDYMHDFIDGKKTSFDGFEKTYGEAELACLEKLIEIVENK